MKNLILHSRFWGIVLILSFWGCQQLEDGVKNDSSRVDGDTQIDPIKSIVFVPEYSDGKAVMYYSTGTDGSFFPGEAALRFEISPAAMAEKLAAGWETSLNVKLLYTKTKAAAGEIIDLSVTGAFASDGILTVTVSGEKIDDKAFFQKELSASVRLLATIGGNQKSSEYVSIRPEASDAIIVPDAVFKKYLIDNFDVNHDGEFTPADALAVTSIDISNKGVCSLAGTEHLSNLLSLNCEDNQITELDLSGCPLLEALSCGKNKLASLELGDCPSLEQLFCNDNNLTSLDLSACPLLLTLSCCGNQLRSLKLDGCGKLTEMYIDPKDEKLNAISGESISIKGFNQADTFELNLENTPFTSLSFTRSPQLSSITLYGNFTDISVQGNSGLTSIDVTKFPELESLDVSDCRLRSLDVTKNTKLKRLLASFLSVAVLDLASNTRLCILDLTGNARLSRVVCPSQDWLDNLCVFDNHSISFVDISGRKLQNSVGVKIDGVYWAAYNVGASDDNLYGDVVEAEMAQYTCPEGWRAPIVLELESLSANYSPSTIVNGMSGRWFSGSKTYSSSSPAIFLPYQKNNYDIGRYLSSYVEYASNGVNYYYYLYFDSLPDVRILKNYGILDSREFFVRCIKI